MHIILRTMRHDDIPVCSSIVCTSSIGYRYGFTVPSLSASIAKAFNTGNLLIVGEAEGEIAGFLWVDPLGAFSSAPYLRLIAVDKQYRGTGVGATLLHEFELKTKHVGRDFFLLVSDFNDSAIRFYKQHGYNEVGTLPNFAKPGITEIIMVKHRKVITS